VNYIRPTALFLILFTLLFGGIYPAMITAILQTFFAAQSQGSLIIDKNGQSLGSELIGQNTTSPQYFWGRPSATPEYAYNSASSGGSNLSASNPALIQRIKLQIKALKTTDTDNTKEIPVDLVTTSASGLDPDISLAAVLYQSPRVAKARGMTEDQLQQIIQQYTQGRQWGILGEPVVNVLKLNLALDGKL